MKRDGRLCKLLANLSEMMGQIMCSWYTSCWYWVDYNRNSLFAEGIRDVDK